MWKAEGKKDPRSKQASSISFLCRFNICLFCCIIVSLFCRTIFSLFCHDFVFISPKIKESPPGIVVVKPACAIVFLVGIGSDAKFSGG
jgi:hypothetical protein